MGLTLQVEACKVDENCCTEGAKECMETLIVRFLAVNEQFLVLMKYHISKQLGRKDDLHISTRSCCHRALLGALLVPECARRKTKHTMKLCLKGHDDVRVTEQRRQ